MSKPHNPEASSLRCLRVGMSSAAVLLVATLTATQGHLARASQQDDVKNLCSLTLNDARDWSAEMDARFSKGSDAEAFASYAKNLQGVTEGWSGEKFDLPRGVVYGYIYSVECTAGNTNSNIWSLYVLADESRKVWKSDFRVLLRDENFAARGVPFDFNYFSRKKDAIRALSSVAPPGTPRERLRTLLGGAGASLTVDPHEMFAASSTIRSLCI
jgi:hypothetical protein